MTTRFDDGGVPEYLSKPFYDSPLSSELGETPVLDLTEQSESGGDR